MRGKSGESSDQVRPLGSTGGEREERSLALVRQPCADSDCPTATNAAAEDCGAWERREKCHCSLSEGKPAQVGLFSLEL